MTWVEKQFSRKNRRRRPKRSAICFGARWSNTSPHAQTRIELLWPLSAARWKNCFQGSAAHGPELGAISVGSNNAVCRLATKARANRGAWLRPSRTPVERAARIAAEINGLVGKENALDECRRAGGGSPPRSGPAQDRTLANCRMLVRLVETVGDGR